MQNYQACNELKINFIDLKITSLIRAFQFLLLIMETGEDNRPPAPTCEAQLPQQMVPRHYLAQPTADCST